MLSQTNSAVRAQAMMALWQIEEDTNLVARAMAEVEQAPDAAPCKQFLNVLGAIGPAARPAIPVILRAMTNSARFPNASQVDVPTAGRAALRKIDLGVEKQVR